VVQQRALLATVVEYRRRLQAVVERAGKNSDTMLHSLTEWCRDAEASGIAALQAYARQLRGYALMPARA
jgi:stearoyl-CoA desaturase (Delta-9 desaturase)